MKKQRSWFSRLKGNVAKGNEDGARRTVVEELFHDLNRSRVQVYRLNFFRGIFFGAGSVVGGTVVIALVVWALSLIGAIFPPLGDFFDGLSQLLKSGER